jgi:hypothetical protein
VKCRSKTRLKAISTRAGSENLRSYFLASPSARFVSSTISSAVARSLTAAPAADGLTECSPRPLNAA